MSKFNKSAGYAIIIFFLFFSSWQTIFAEGEQQEKSAQQVPQTNASSNNQQASGGQENGTTYKNLEKIPGFEPTSNFIQYLENLYKFGIGITAILAVMMIGVGAFQYIVGSAGNAGKAGDGKDRIYSAIYGLVLAMLVYLIFFLINPDILKGSIEGSSHQPGYNGSGTNGSGAGGGGTSSGYKNACPDPTSKEPIDYSKAASDPKIQLPSQCAQYRPLFEQAGRRYNVDPCVLEAIAMKESRCGADKGPSSTGDCGLMQISQTTAGKSCPELMNDEVSVDFAAKFIAQNQARAAGAKNQTAGIFAGYNTGYGCNSSGGKTPSLCASKDCPGSMAFECCINPGGLDTVINYAWNATGYYNQCKNQK